MSQKPRLLLHTCCAPCAAPSIERCLGQAYHVTLYYSNSNIAPLEEYEKRKAEVIRLAGLMEVLFDEDHYDHAGWLEAVQGYESEPEKGERCRICFAWSLARTAELAEHFGFDHFATTLTLSPHKVSRIIFEIGGQYPRFLPLDFKKQDGFRRSLELSREWDLYRQSYCGCEFSLRDRR
jgi:predicted adenine nucleotide alpha hydrolase (AANH) superfamily ATPase